MSVNANYTGNIQKPAFKALADGNTARVGDVVPNNSLCLASWLFCNTTGSSVNCSLFWYDGTTEHEIWRRPVPANDSVGAMDWPIRVREGHEIRAKGASGINVTLVYAQALTNTSQ